MRPNPADVFEETRQFTDLESALFVCPSGSLLVRREKAPIHSGGESRPGTGSLHPVAIGATAEVTTLLKPLMERVT